MCFDCGVGLAGSNRIKLWKAHELRTKKRHIDVIAVADFNMTEAEWSNDILNRLDMQIITPNAKHT